MTYLTQDSGIKDMNINEVQLQHGEQGWGGGGAQEKDRGTEGSGGPEWDESGEPRVRKSVPHGHCRQTHKVSNYLPLEEIGYNYLTIGFNMFWNLPN